MSEIQRVLDNKIGFPDNYYDHGDITTLIEMRKLPSPHLFWNFQQKKFIWPPLKFGSKNKIPWCLDIYKDLGGQARNMAQAK